jgi:hypothetical protein
MTTAATSNRRTRSVTRRIAINPFMSSDATPQWVAYLWLKGRISGLVPL